MPDRRRKGSEKSPGFTLGLAGFARISAVEGVHLDARSERMFAEFERRELSPEERRAAIRRKHAPTI
jgi:hypothetical protein